jgi:hypothetical protein
MKKDKAKEKDKRKFLAECFEACGDDLPCLSMCLEAQPGDP